MLFFSLQTCLVVNFVNLRILDSKSLANFNNFYNLSSSPIDHYCWYEKGIDMGNQTSLKTSQRECCNPFDPSPGSTSEYIVRDYVPRFNHKSDKLFRHTCSRTKRDNIFVVAEFSPLVH